MYGSCSVAVKLLEGISWMINGRKQGIKMCQLRNNAFVFHHHAIVDMGHPKNQCLSAWSSFFQSKLQFWGMPHFWTNPYKRVFIPGSFMPISTCRWILLLATAQNSWIFDLRATILALWGVELSKTNHFLPRKVRESRFQEGFMNFTTQRHIVLQIFQLYDQPFNLLFFEVHKDLNQTHVFLNRLRFKALILLTAVADSSGLCSRCRRFLAPSGRACCSANKQG